MKNLACLVCVALLALSPIAALARSTGGGNPSDPTSPPRPLCLVFDCCPDFDGTQPLLVNGPFTAPCVDVSTAAIVPLDNYEGEHP